MKKINVYTYYDDTKTVIAQIIPRENSWTISERTYKNLLKRRTVGGNAGIYTNAPKDIRVINNAGDIIEILRGVKK